ncbi:copper amine oxidase domain containing protein [Clostridium aceticum]|uniref:Copper amine oxidase domain containing protein n=1 Tax=Clostridium aceticum TaxID=84022 RepID=A0A0G3W747_9CLOT|nr:stalk domain-containing protein [Clostridium aceticum]AKL93670.1 copper amine oxidase domain containing protein [Clostridium aceticum]
MKKISKIAALALSISLFLGSLSLASGITPSLEVDKSIIGVMVNYRHLQFDQDPVMMEGRTLVPVAAIFKELHLSVLWDAETRTVVGSTHDEELVIMITLDSKTAYINGEEVELQAPATAINGRTMVPVRFIAEATGATVDWDAEENLVIIKTPGTGSYEDMFHEEIFYEDKVMLTEEELLALPEEE